MSWIDDIVKQTETMTFKDIVDANNQDGALKALLDIACPLFERFESGVQGVALSLIYGMLLAAIEGEVCEAEKTEGVIITAEDRIRLFVTTVWVTLREALEETRATQIPTGTTRH